MCACGCVCVCACACVFVVVGECECRCVCRCVCVSVSGVQGCGIVEYQTVEESIQAIQSLNDTELLGRFRV